MMARRFGKLRTETVSACVRQPEEIELLKEFKVRCREGGASVQGVLLCLVREWLHPYQGDR